MLKKHVAWNLGPVWIVDFGDYKLVVVPPGHARRPRRPCIAARQQRRHHAPRFPPAHGHNRPGQRVRWRGNGRRRAGVDIAPEHAAAVLDAIVRVQPGALRERLDAFGVTAPMLGLDWTPYAGECAYYHFVPAADLPLVLPFSTAIVMVAEVVRPVDALAAVEVVRVLLERGCNPDEYGFGLGAQRDDAIITVCKSEYIADEHAAALVRLLAKHGANLKTYDIWGQTPLQLCVFNGNWQAATALLLLQRGVVGCATGVSFGLYPLDYEFDAPDCIDTVETYRDHARFAVLLRCVCEEIIHIGDAFDNEAGRVGFAEWNYLMRDANAWAAAAAFPPSLAALLLEARKQGVKMFACEHALAGLTPRAVAAVRQRAGRLSGHHDPAEALRLLRCATRLVPWAPCRHRCYCNASERRMVAAVLRVAHRIQALPAELWHLVCAFALAA